MMQQKFNELTDKIIRIKDLLDDIDNNMNNIKNELNKNE